MKDRSRLESSTGDVRIGGAGPRNEDGVLVKGIVFQPDGGVENIF